MKQGIVSAGCSDGNHCEGVVCFAPLVLPQQLWMEPKEVSAAPTPCSSWNGCNIPQLCIAVIERPSTGSGDFLYALLCFLKPFHSDGFGEQLLGIPKRP